MREIRRALFIFTSFVRLRSGHPAGLRRPGGRAARPSRPRPARAARSPCAIHAAARWLIDSSCSALASAVRSISCASSSRPCSISARPSTSWVGAMSSRKSSRPSRSSSACRASSSADLHLAGRQVHVGERRDDVGRLGVAALVEQDAVGALQVLDRALGLAELEVEAAEVVQQAADVALVVELLVVGLRALRVAAREHPVAHALGDERGLEVDVRHRAVVVERLRQLERALDVLARGLEVALAAVAAGAPAEDLGAKQVARQLRALGELERLAEQRDGRGDARKVVAADADAEEHLRAVDVREAGPLGERAAALEQLERGPNLAPLHAAPRPRLRAREPRARSRRSPSTAVREFSSSSTASSYWWAFAQRLGAGEHAPRPGCARRRRRRVSRKPASTPSLAASHSIVSRVGRVLPRSIWLTYSFEKRSPARSVCVRPAATRSCRTRSPRRALPGWAAGRSWRVADMRDRHKPHAK